MPYEFNCPCCNAKLEAQEEWGGQTTQCPICSKNIAIPPMAKPQLIKSQPGPMVYPVPASEKNSADRQTMPAGTGPSGTGPSSTGPSGAGTAVTPAKSRTTYLILGILLGGYGAHDFYAGYTTNGWIKVGITVLSCFTLSLGSWIWAIVDVCTIKVDANGRPFEN